MPRVELYGEQKVRTRPIAGVKRTAAAGGIGGGAAGMAEFGALGARIAGNVANTMATAARERADQAAILEATNKYAAAENAILFDPTTGALTVKGKDSQGLLDTVPGQLATTAGEIGASLSNPRQQFEFEKFRSQRDLATDYRLRTHVAREMQEFDQNETKSFVENLTNHAIANADTPAIVNMDLAQVVEKTEAFGLRNGMGPEQRAAIVGAARTNIHSGVIDQLLSQEQDQAASAYYTAVHEQIDGAARAKIEKALEAGTTQGAGLRTANDIWARLGPKGDQDPIQLDKMEEAAREMFADDPKKLDMTVRYLRERKQGVDAGRKERDDAVIGGLWKMAAEGQSLSQVQRSSEYRNASGDVQARISDYIVTRAERVENRAAAAESRAAARENRAWTREQRAQAQAYDAGRYMFYQYAKPEVLTTMTDPQVWALTEQLGERSVGELFELRQRWATNKTAALAATIDGDLFNELANDAGFKVFAPTKTESDKAAIGRLRNDVEAAIAVEQARTPTTALPREQKEKIMQSVLDRKVMVDGWFGDTSRAASAVVNQKDQANAYVPVSDIPPARLAFSLNYLRSVRPGYRGLTDTQIQQRAKAAIERAYAAMVLDLGEAEVKRRFDEAK